MDKVQRTGSLPVDIDKLYAAINDVIAALNELKSATAENTALTDELKPVKVGKSNAKANKD